MEKSPIRFRDGTQTASDVSAAMRQRLIEAGYIEHDHDDERGPVYRMTEKGVLFAEGMDV